jgi:hypothetical protein
VAKYEYTEYFEKEVFRKRPYLKKAWCVDVLENAARSRKSTIDIASGRRFQKWGAVT